MPAIPLSVVIPVHSLSHPCNLVSHKTTLYLNEVCTNSSLQTRHIIQGDCIHTRRERERWWWGWEMARAWINFELKLLQFVGCWICWICNVREQLSDFFPTLIPHSQGSALLPSPGHLILLQFSIATVHLTAWMVSPWQFLSFLLFREKSIFCPWACCYLSLSLSLSPLSRVQLFLLPHGL